MRPKGAESLAAALPRGRFTWIPDGGHVLMEEAPEQITEMLRDATMRDAETIRDAEPSRDVEAVDRDALKGFPG
ncbi:hypothetical protein D3C83_225860 [compost metagenome]